MTTSKSYVCEGLVKKWTEKLASCSVLFSVREVCNNEQHDIIPMYNKCRSLVLEFCALFYREALLMFCLGANIKLVCFPWGQSVLITLGQCMYSSIHWMFPCPVATCLLLWHRTSSSDHSRQLYKGGNTFDLLLSFSMALECYGAFSTGILPTSHLVSTPNSRLFHLFHHHVCWNLSPNEYHPVFLFFFF